MARKINSLNSIQLAAIEEYRRRLAEEFPDIKILKVRAINGTIDICLSDNSMRDYTTFNRTTELAIEVEDRYADVVLLPRTIPHEE
ncbi:TPA: hypothetical protein EYP66_17445 [Candidatus Poribacteria bacterium]|nr:hypothetical protein [Candidatus Poribacteria bacterium]